MAIITFEIDDLARLGVEKASIKDIVDRLGMSLEALDKDTATIDITPNRPDMLDIVGFARAALFLLGKKAPKEKFYSIKNNPAMKITVTKAVKKVRPFIAALVVKNVDLSGNKLKDLINFTEKFCETYGRKRKKIACGLYNFDSIKGDLKYDASKNEEFAPLGSKTKMSFVEIIKNHQKGIEYSGALGSSKIYPFLADSENIFSLIPIINSEHSRVNNSTKNLLVEFTGTSQNAVEAAIDMMACSFIEVGAEVYPCEISYPNKKVVTPQLEYREIKIRRSRVENTLGVYLEDNKIIGLGNKLGHVTAKYGNYTIFYIPPYRIDVINEQDVIEDIAIAYGYDKIEPMPVVGISAGRPEPLRVESNRVSKLMIGMGFTEAMNTYLTNEKLNFTDMGHKDAPESTISVGYAKTEAITMMRTNILPWLMQNLSNSTNEKMPQKLFEIGSVFSINNQDVIEEINLGMVSEHSKSNYSEIKAAVLELLKFLNTAKYTLKELQDSTFIEGRAAKIMVGNEMVGYFGEISPKILSNFKIEEPTVAAEIKLSVILKIRQ
jgi:phenylalanyl-tRNA synthetase beta chain